MHNKNLALLAAALPALALTACYKTVSTHGQVIYPSQLAQIQPGVTTADQAKALLGTPSTTGTLNPNRWYYMTDTKSTQPLQPNQLQERKVIILDIDPSTSLVTNLSTKTEADAKQVDAAPEQTRTYGQKLGVLDQLFSNIGLAH